MEKLEKISVFAEFAKVRGEIDEQEYDRLVAGLLTLPGKIGKVLKDKERIPKYSLFVKTIVKVDFAEKFAAAKDIFFLGRALTMRSALREA